VFIKKKGKTPFKKKLKRPGTEKRRRLRNRSVFLSLFGGETKSSASTKVRGGIFANIFYGGGKTKKNNFIMEVKGFERSLRTNLKSLIEGGVGGGGG